MTMKLLQPTGTYEIELSHVDWAKLEETGCVKLREGDRQHLLEVMNDYRRRINMYTHSPRLSEIREPLESLSTALAALGQAVSSTLNPSAASIGAAVFRQIQTTVAIRHDFRLDIVELQTLGDHALKWKGWVRETIENLPHDVGGRIGDPFIDEMLVRIQRIYHEACGRGPYSSSARQFRAVRWKLSDTTQIRPLRSRLGSRRFGEKPPKNS
jgi:hypothetical protein